MMQMNAGSGLYGVYVDEQRSGRVEMRLQGSTVYAQLDRVEVPRRMCCTILRRAHHIEFQLFNACRYHF